MFRFAAISAAALAAPALALAVPASAPAAACPAPHSGYRACLRAQWNVVQGDVSRLKAGVTLVQRAERCSKHGSRRATLRRGSRKLGVMRATASCSNRVVRWHATFTRDDTEDWTLHKGDVLTLSWGGADATATVELTGRPAKR
jgi:hypothetical protein